MSGVRTSKLTSRSARYEASELRRERFVNWLALLVLVSLGIVWPPAFALELSDIHAGSLLLKSAPDSEPLQALRVSTAIRAHVTGNLARVYVQQEFANPGDEWVEGLYVFPLSSTAAVDELLMRVGERTIRGEIERRQAARAKYEKARTEGKRASLVDQARPNMFTSSVANIAPRSSITVEIAYLDVIPYRDERYTLNLPLAITPRYTPGVALDPAAHLASTNAVRMNAMLGSSTTAERVTTAKQHVTIDVHLAPGFAIESVRSLHHEVVIESDAMDRRIELTGPDVSADRDFELVWTPVVKLQTQAAVFAEQRESGTYALVALTPPALTGARSERREVLFIIDTSGSMHGPSIEQARAALWLGVDRLSEGDRFNIIRFSNDATSLFRSAQPASAASRALAGRFIESLQAQGGTEMRSALELAFAMEPTQDMLRQIVFITDGSVGNEAQLVAMIRQRIADARLFTVGIGAAPNAYFMREAAAAGRGSYTYIAQIEHVGERMRDLFRKLEEPALLDLELHWPDDVTVELATDLPGDVYAGDPLVVVVRLPRMPRGLLTLTGRSRGQAWVQQVPIRLLDAHAGIAKLWARERIAGLSRQMSLSASTADIESQITELALSHHLVSPFTSLVAVDVTPVRPAGAAVHPEQVPTAAPSGSYWARTTGFAPTATAAPALFLTGLVALLLAAVIRRAAGPA